MVLLGKPAPACAVGVCGVPPRRARPSQTLAFIRGRSPALSQPQPPSDRRQMEQIHPNRYGFTELIEDGKDGKEIGEAAGEAIPIVSPTPSPPQPSEFSEEPIRPKRMISHLRDGFTELIEDGMETSEAAGQAVAVFQNKHATVNERLKSALKLLARLFSCLVGFYACLFGLCKAVYLRMRKYEWAEQLIIMLCGLVLCFFGGVYIVSLAALEAAYRMGGTALLDDLYYVYKTVQKVSKEVLSDAQNEQLDQQDLYDAMVKIEQPMKLQSAMSNLWSVYVAVLATLSMQFAQVVTIALGMASCIRPTMLKILRPPIAMILTTSNWKLHHWLDHHRNPDGDWLEEHAESKEEGESVLISTVVNVLVMWFAWTLYAFVAAYYAGLRGGRMFADALLGKEGFLSKFCKGHCCGCFEEGSCLANWLDSDGYADEVVMYVLAAMGIWAQVESGFKLFFPLNIVLMPLTLIEWFLRYQVTFGGIAAAGAAG